MPMMCRYWPPSFILAYMNIRWLFPVPFTAPLSSLHCCCSFSLHLQHYCLLHFVSTSSNKCFIRLPLPSLRLYCSNSGMIVLLLI
uniref:Uncharacterized protein n=1 Tax=Setaria italica TaxID=4555 RepID=K4A417_SETIT